MQEGIGMMIPCRVIGNINNDKEFEARMKKEQAESEMRERNN